jgi:D-alanyl-D-alanine dipeptidase
MSIRKQPQGKLNESRDSSNISYSPIFYKGDTLVPVNYFNVAIFCDLKYAGTDNFMSRQLYDTFSVAYVQIDVARRLSNCQQLLSTLKPDLHLLVYDGLRPLSVQWEMWKALDSIPVIERGKFVSNPANGSLHNFGAAIDLTICSSEKKPMDMGALYDDIRKIAYPSMEKYYYSKGELTGSQIAHRKLLRKVMRSGNFHVIPTEWWHFNAYTLTDARKKYAIVTKELTEN